jgi:DNA-binding transcriptional LysR family regulator
MTTLRALECLVALVELGSMSAAAESLYMSQPALSHQIAALEKEMGAPVVERRGRGVRVTVAGQAAAEEARIALRAAEKAVQVGKRTSRCSIPGEDRLRIACVETMPAWLLAPVLRQWRSRRPDVTLDLSEFTSSDAMVEVLAAGETDVAVGPRPTQTESYAEVFGQEEMVVVAAAGHRFADLSTVPIHALADEMFVHYHPSNGMAMWVDQLAAQHQIALAPVVRTISPRTAAHLAAAGLGVTVVPASALVSGPSGVVRRLRPMVKRDIIAMVAAPSDTLVQEFIADLHRHGLPKTNWPK